MSIQSAEAIQMTFDVPSLSLPTLGTESEAVKNSLVKALEYAKISMLVWLFKALIKISSGPLS